MIYYVVEKYYESLAERGQPLATTYIMIGRLLIIGRDDRGMLVLYESMEWEIKCMDLIINLIYC